MKRNYVLLGMMVLTAILTISVYGQDQAKTFSAYKCQLKLPAASWQWNDQLDQPDLLAFAEAKNGMMLLLSVIPLRDGKFNSDYWVGFEEEFLKSTGARKLEAKSLLFQELPAYELTSILSEADVLMYSRIFMAHQVVYSLQLMIPQKMKTSPAVRERLFNSFSFTEKPNQPGQEQVPDKQPSKAKTDPNEVSARKDEFSDPNALLKELGLKTVKIGRAHV